MAGTLEIGQIDLISADGLSTSVIKTENSGVCSINKGLRLPNVAVNDSTVLDWYEEGTFTPTVIGTTTSGVGTYTVNKGKFTRIGNKVHIEVIISLSSHTGTGNMRIAGIPFAINSDFNYESVALLDYSNLTVSGIPYVIAAAGQTTLWPAVMTTSGGTPSSLAMDTSCVLAFSMTYSV